MNAFNRLLLILLSLAAIAAAVVVLLLTFGVEANSLASWWDWLERRLQPFEDLDDTGQVWAAAISIAVIVAGLILLVLEIPKPGRRPEPRMTLQSGGLGRVTVTRMGVQELASREAHMVDGVREFQSQVGEDRDGLHIRGRASVDPQANLPDVARQVQERVKGAVEQHLGVKVADVAVDAQLQPLTDGRRRVR